MSGRRASAIGSLLLGLGGFGLAMLVAVREFPTGLIAFVFIICAIAGAWYGIARQGALRVAGLAGAAAAVIAAGLLTLDNGLLLELIVIGVLAASCACARTAFGASVQLPRAPAPQRPVLFFNPKSGGGKAERFSLGAEARSRGIKPIELTLGADLEQLVRDAVADGADALAMAGGDGSQAVVAAVAAELGLPYACVPAGTRNHFALDLGVDRDDVVGALDAFVDGGERRVDLAEVNGRVFVNNVSLGVYAEAVQRQGYRDAKFRTLFETLSQGLGPGQAGPGLRWTGKGGHEHRSSAAMLVSNNRYRLGHAVGSGTRPRIDDGLLGIAVAGAPTGRGVGRGRLSQRPWREWTAPVFRVDADDVLPAGIDGEAAELDPPLCFRCRPMALQVRISRAHPGASPSALMPEHFPQAVLALARIATGNPAENGHTDEPVSTMPIETAKREP